MCRRYFNPRPPWGGRREDIDNCPKNMKISIHALRGEGDIRPDRRRAQRNHFNPRPPWGGRHVTKLKEHPDNPRKFQSTPSVGRATLIVRPKLRPLVISIHALRGEGDFLHPRPRAKIKISIHALRGEGDIDKDEFCSLSDISIHALRGEGDCKNIQICNAMLVHSVYKTVYFCDSCAFYLT